MFQGFVHVFGKGSIASGAQMSGETILKMGIGINFAIQSVFIFEKETNVNRTVSITIKYI